MSSAIKKRTWILSSWKSNSLGTYSIRLAWKYSARGKRRVSPQKAVASLDMTVWKCGLPCGTWNYLPKAILTVVVMLTWFWRACLPRAEENSGSGTPRPLLLMTDWFCCRYSLLAAGKGTLNLLPIKHNSRASAQGSWMEAACIPVKTSLIPSTSAYLHNWPALLSGQKSVQCEEPRHNSPKINASKKAIGDGSPHFQASRVLSPPGSTEQVIH